MAKYGQMDPPTSTASDRWHLTSSNLELVPNARQAELSIAIASACVERLAYIKQMVQIVEHYDTHHKTDADYEAQRREIVKQVEGPICETRIAVCESLLDGVGIRRTDGAGAAARVADFEHIGEVEMWMEGPIGDAETRRIKMRHEGFTGAHARFCDDDTEVEVCRAIAAASVECKVLLDGVAIDYGSSVAAAVNAISRLRNSVRAGVASLALLLAQQCTHRATLKHRARWIRGVFEPRFVARAATLWPPAQKIKLVMRLRLEASWNGAQATVSYATEGGPWNYNRGPQAYIEFPLSDTEIADIVSTTQGLCKAFNRPAQMGSTQLILITNELIASMRAELDPCFPSVIPYSEPASELDPEVVAPIPAVPEPVLAPVTVPSPSE